jgi:hypothetical protein
LKKIDVPTLIMDGDGDQIVTIGRTVRVRRDVQVV